MNYTFNSKYRYDAVRTHSALTSPTLMGVFLIAVIMALLAWLFFVIITATVNILALAILLTSLVGTMGLLITFANTYYPYLPARRTVQSLITLQQKRPINVASAASFSLLYALGRHGQYTQTQSSLAKSVDSLLRSPHIDHLLNRLQFDRQTIKAAILEHGLTGLTWPAFAESMLKLAQSLKQSVITPEHAFGVLILHPSLQSFNRSRGLTEKDIQFVLWWGGEERHAALTRRRWWDASRLFSFTSLGLNWASGFTPFVDQFARLPPGSAWDDIIYGHEDKVDELINTLARQRQSNVLLVGDPGVGRIGIIRTLAKRIHTSTAHPILNGQRVLYINASELIARGSSPAQQLSLISRALREMERAGNIITIIDGLSSVLGAAGERRANLGEVLLPFLASLTVRVVVMTSSDDYHLRLKSNQELIHYFEIVQVSSLSEADTLKRLALTVPTIERSSNLVIPYQTLRTLVDDTASILPHIPFPERAFDFLEEAIVLAQIENASTLKPRHIHTLIARRIGVNPGTVRSKERQQLLNLENIMHRRLVNQETAVKTVVKAMIRARAQVTNTKRPIGTFLFLGPTGVGKTETAKTLAEAYFGSEKHLTRLDMSEFQGEDAVARLIGSRSQPVGRLTSLIADHPFTILLLDEFEKASEQVHQLFLQVFDEGWLTDITDRKYVFNNAIIIATSNAGAELIRQEAKDGHVPPGFDEKLKEYILQHHIFSPELINRFDGVVTFSTLSKQHINKIAVLMLRKLNKRLDAKHGITVAITDQLVATLVKSGYDPEFGARPLARAMQDTVEYAVAQKILQGLIEPGQQIVLSPMELGIDVV